MSQQSDAPQLMIDSSNGYYCDQFQPNDNHKPKIWTENWTGGYKNWGMQNPHRPAEDVAYAVSNLVAHFKIIICTMVVPTLNELPEAHMSLLRMTMTLLWKNMVI